MHMNFNCDLSILLLKWEMDCSEGCRIAVVKCHLFCMTDAYDILLVLVSHQVSFANLCEALGKEYFNVATPQIQLNFLNIYNRKNDNGLDSHHIIVNECQNIVKSSENFIKID
jgi:hypothetical protein